MKTISGTYPSNFSIQIPSQWDELEKTQFARIIEILNFRKADKFTIGVSLLSLLFGSKNWHILNKLADVKPEENDGVGGDELLTQLIPLTNFFLEEKPPVKNYFQSLNIKKRKYTAPADDLSNLCFGEWCFAHQYYIYYAISNDVEWLNKLIATIYRPIDETQNEDSPTYTGDLREAFNENLIEKRALSVANVESHIKLGILAWFTCALNQLTEQRPHVFPPQPEVHPDAEPQPQPHQEPDLSRTWMTIFRELLGPKWGTEKDLKFTNAMFILDELEDRHIAYEEAKKQN